MGMIQRTGQHAARLQSACLFGPYFSASTAKMAAPLGYYHNNVLRGWGKVPMRFTLL